MKTSIAILAVVLVGTIGYLTLDREREVSTQSDSILQSDKLEPIIQNTTNLVSQNGENSCGLLADSLFKSINKHEVGLGPDGAVMGYWNIIFGKVGLAGDSKENGVAWHHSDVVESGTYTCKNDAIEVKFLDYSITAKYDADKEILIWNGVEYKRVNNI